MTRQRLAAAALAVAAAAVLTLVLDASASVGRFGVGGAPVVAGTLVLYASITWPARRAPTLFGLGASVVAGGGAALLAGRGDLSDAGGALAIAAALVVVAARAEADRGLAPAALSALGAAGVLYGLVRLEGDTGAFARGGGTFVALGAAAVVLGAGSRTRRAGVVLLPLALLLGAQSAPSLRVALACAVVALLVTDRPAASLGLWAIAAAAISAPAAVLLGAAAVLTAAWLHPLAPLAALPGAAALAFAAAQHGSPLRLALAFVAALTVARLWDRDDGDVVDVVPAPATLAAIALGAWLVVAPETWSFAGAAGLGSWGTGVGIAVAAAAVAAFGVASFTDTEFPVPGLEVADPAYAPGEARGAGRAAIGALAILGIAGSLLVASVLS